MRIGRHLTVQEVYNQIDVYNQSITQPTEVIQTVYVHEDGVVGKLAKLLGINDVILPHTFLWRSTHTVANNTDYDIVWDHKEVDGAEVWQSGEQNELYVSRDGVYEFSLEVIWNTNSTGERFADMIGNIAPRIYSNLKAMSAAVVTRNAGSCVCKCDKGDTIKFRTKQTSGGNLAIASARLYVIRRSLYQPY